MKKIKMITTGSILFLLFLSATIPAQTEMNMKDYKPAMDAGINRERTAKEGIAEAQVSVSALKEQLKETNKQIAKNRADMFAAAGTTPEGLKKWQDKINTLQSQADAFAALSTSDVLARQSEVLGFESQLSALKADKAVNLPASPVLLSAVENSVSNASAAISKAQSDAQASAASEQQAKIDEAKQKAEAAKQAKLEAKQKAADEKQAKLEAKRQAAEAVAQAAPAASGDPLAGLEDLQAGTTYRVKYVEGNRQTLSKMALKLWGDAKQWTKIYDANKDKIEKAFNDYKQTHPDAKYPGPEDFIVPGQELIIPQ